MGMSCIGSNKKMFNKKHYREFLRIYSIYSEGMFLNSRNMGKLKS